MMFFFFEGAKVRQFIFLSGDNQVVDANKKSRQPAGL